MTDLRTAAQQALEALELAQTDVYWELNSPTRKFLRKAEKNLRAALAEPEFPIGQATTDVGVPVYVLKKAEPAQRKPLSEEEIINIGKEARAVEGPHILPVAFARAIERAHGITP